MNSSWAKTSGSFNDFTALEWDQLEGNEDFPFLNHGWLKSLEESGCISEETDWSPCIIHNNPRDTGLKYTAPLFIRRRSIQGEFIFDFFLQELAANAGLRYYPRIVGCSPFTPASGYRPLVGRSSDRSHVWHSVIDKTFSLSDEIGAAGIHFNYCDKEFSSFLVEKGFARWKHPGFLIDLSGFSDFSDYLAIFRKNQRRNIKRERASVESQGLRVHVYTQDELQVEHLVQMHRFYAGTNMKFGPWAAWFLNESFFRLAHETSRSNIVFVCAQEESGNKDIVAGALLVAGKHTLYGRYWGAAGMYKDLHFELCYYKPMEWAIQNGISFFDPGIGSEHKLRRGFIPVHHESCHFYTNPLMQEAARRIFHQINDYEQQNILEQSRQLPIKQN